MESQQYNDYYAPGQPTGTDEALGLFLGAFMGVALLFAVIYYVVNAIFLMKLLKNSGHRSPAAAWVPFWNQAALTELGGIRKPWIWVLVLFGVNILAGLIPVVGFLLSLAGLAAAIVLMVYIAKGVQAGLGINSTGGLVLAVIVPLAWIIWMSIASGKRKYNLGAALSEGDRFPMNWFGESDRLAPFGAPVAGNSYGQSQPFYGGGPNPGYQAPQQPGGTGSQQPHGSTPDIYGATPRPYSPDQNGGAPAQPGYAAPPAQPNPWVQQAPPAPPAPRPYSDGFSPQAGSNGEDGSETDQNQGRNF